MPYINQPIFYIYHPYGKWKMGHEYFDGEEWITVWYQ